MFEPPLGGPAVKSLDTLPRIAGDEFDGEDGMVPVEEHGVGNTRVPSFARQEVFRYPKSSARRVSAAKLQKNAGRVQVMGKLQDVRQFAARDAAEGVHGLCRRAENGRPSQRPFP